MGGTETHACVGPKQERVVVLKLLVTVPWDATLFQNLTVRFPQIAFTTALTTREALVEVADAEVVFGDFSRDVYLAAKKLRWVQCHGAGVNKLTAIPELMAGDVQITSTKGAHAATIAEHFFGLLIGLARQFPKLQQAQQRHEWTRWSTWKETIGNQPLGLQGLTLGIVGLGNIGHAIAERARAFGMTIIAVDLRPVERPESVSALWTLDQLPELLKRADAVAVTVPGTPETTGMLGREMLQSMKSSAFLVVVSRGGVVDEQALVSMLKDGQLAGAALDVMDPEPPPPDSPLWSASNLILTPHIAGKSTNTTAAATEIFSDNLTRYLAGRPLRNLVDKELGF